MNSQRSERPPANPDPSQVPAKVKVFLGDIGPRLAVAANSNGRTLSEEIRERLKKSIQQDEEKQRKSIDD